MSRFMRYVAIIFFCITGQRCFSQELFAYTEPASNMAVKSIGVRTNNYLLRENATGNYHYSGAVELMYGVSKKLMIHGETFFGNEPKQFRIDGASVYAKYRFYAEDEVHSHFRMALTGKLSGVSTEVSQAAIDLAGKNSGAEFGIIATKLMHKTALSAGISFVHAFNDKTDNKFITSGNGNALNYNLSLGQLFLPKEYTDYKQTNLNGMLEFLGQTNTRSGNTYIDLAPSLQLIFFSKVRLDAGYRFPVVHSLSRSADRGFLLRVEYNFFNAFK